MEETEAASFAEGGEDGCCRCEVISDDEEVSKTFDSCSESISFVWNKVLLFLDGVVVMWLEVLVLDILSWWCYWSFLKNLKSFSCHTFMESSGTFWFLEVIYI